MTLPEAVEILREFRKLNLGPDLSLAIDTVVAEYAAVQEQRKMARELADASIRRMPAISPSLVA